MLSVGELHGRRAKGEAIHIVWSQHGGRIFLAGPTCGQCDKNASAPAAYSFEKLSPHRHVSARRLTLGHPWRKNSHSVCADGKANPDGGCRLATASPRSRSFTAISAALITTATPLTTGAPSTWASAASANSIIGIPPVGTITSA